jgi:hypothetical protein
MKTLFSIFLPFSLWASPDGLIPKTEKTEVKGSIVKNQLKWFYQKDFTSLEILVFSKASDKVPQKTFTLNDSKKIQHLIAQIEQLPVEGEMMVSWSEDVPYTELRFVSPKSKESIEIYQGRFKTPGTSFFADEKMKQAEKKIYTEILSHLK